MAFIKLGVVEVPPLAKCAYKCLEHDHLNAYKKRRKSMQIERDPPF